MGLHRADGTAIADRAALDALTTSADDDPPVTLNEDIYQDVVYPKTSQGGTRLLWREGQTVRSSDLDAALAQDSYEPVSAPS